MKKALFTVALLMSACFVSAQKSVVKEAKSLKKDPAKAAVVIEKALTNQETANDPETWKLAGDFQKAIYEEENVKMFIPGGKADTTKMYTSLAKMCEYYMQCDVVEQDAVAKGTAKKAKFRKKNAESVKTLRTNLLNGGVDAFNKTKYEDALKYFGLFVDVAYSPLFEEDEAMKADTLNTLYANYAAMAAGAVKNSEAVIKYGNIGKVDKNEGWRSLMYMSEVYGNKENGDSAKWLEVIVEGANKFPKQDFFVGNMMDYYLQKGMVDEALGKIDELLTQNETPYYLYVKSVLLLEKKQYDASIECCNKVIAKNDILVAEAYAKIGDNYFMPAQELSQANSNLSVEDPKYNENEAKVKELLGKAKPFYEKAKELAPDNKPLWGQFLLNIYWKLNRAEYEALEKEING